MAYEKLTPKQEKFVYEIAKGKTQRQAYLTAYPNSKNYQENTVDSRASVLMRNKKVVKRLDEIKTVERDKVRWTRDRALNEINYVLDINKKDIERQQEGYEEELAVKNQELKEWIKLLTVPNIDKQAIQEHIKSVVSEISYIKQRRRVSAVNTNGILNAARVLNRMFGYDITKVEVKQEDNERDEIKKLSLEELKALAYANKKDDND